MPSIVQPKSKTLLGISDLTLMAPIKVGLIPALDARSYETRLRLLLRTLGASRSSSLEVAPTPLLHDAVDRIRGIHAFRLAIVGPGSPQARVVLAVDFDSAWEPYMRRIWRDLGPLLDVIFCNCEGYLSAAHHSFADYSAWVRSAQIPTEFFYTASSLSVHDLHYLRRREQERNGGGLAARTANKRPLEEQALPALTALYRLADMYPPGLRAKGGEDDDGGFLLRAAQSLLHPLIAYFEANPKGTLGATTPTEFAAVEWFQRDAEPPLQRIREDTFDRAQVQGGILEPYSGITHGCLVLLGLRDAAAAIELIDYLQPQLTTATGRAGSQSLTFVNLGFTYEGLQRAGLEDDTLAQFPQEFREGMAARASVLGDYLHNHPAHWTLPESNWPQPAARPAERVQLSAVHAVVQLSYRGNGDDTWHDIPDKDQHPLEEAVRKLDTALQAKGVTVLSVQAMQRKLTQDGKHSIDHFDFADGFSQPTLDQSGKGQHHDDTVKPGDLLLGSRNSLNDSPLTGRLWNNSSFLVIRKLRQNVAALDTALAKSNPDLQTKKMTLAKMMGRWQDGRNLIDDTTPNDFNYASDARGDKCPMRAHIRRANPRLSDPDVPRPPHEEGLPSAPTPRIMRRGMSYGPRVEEDPKAERGLVFMAYNASIAEQFEVIQRWISGGNASGDASYSSLRDPFLGVPQDGDPQFFEFSDGQGSPQRVDLTASEPFVVLQWGAYVFAPSLRALDELRSIAEEARQRNADPNGEQRKRVREREIANQAAKGAFLIKQLLAAEQTLGFKGAAEQWKIALEDMTSRMSGASEWIWTAVRELHGGALRTPYGVLVCSSKLVNDVFASDTHYTVSGYQSRMRRSFGEIYLGMDQSPQYRNEADAVNAAIMEVTELGAFDSAYTHTQSAIGSLLDADPVDLDVKDIVDKVLAAVSKDYFGIPDGSYVEEGGWQWHQVEPTCPGHFHSPSRYMFQPNPGDEASLFGEAHGQALRAAVARFVAVHRQSRTPPGKLSPSIFAAVPQDSRQDQLASTLIGVMMGFLPTVDGNLRATLYEWVNDRSLWDHQLTYRSVIAATAYERASAALRGPLVRTMQLRPVPELVWRTALTSHHLGKVQVNPGERVVVSIVSAMQENRRNEVDDLFPVFGGDRSQATHPTHACPGYQMARGVLLGTLAALLEFDLTPTASPLVLKIHR